MPDDKKIQGLWNIIEGLRLRLNEIHNKMNENEDKFVLSCYSDLMRENFLLIEEQSEVSRKILDAL